MMYQFTPNSPFHTGTEKGPPSLFLDYDGTLSPIVAPPQLAAPDRDLLELLDNLAAQLKTEPDSLKVHAVSGRGRIDLQAYLGHLPFDLHAGHGLMSSTAPVTGEREWTLFEGVSGDFIKQVQAQRDKFIRPLMEESIKDSSLYIDGAPPVYLGHQALLVEEKEVPLVLHYRSAEMVLGRDLEAWANGRAAQFQAAIDDHGLDLEVKGTSTDKNREVQLKPGSIEVHKGNIIREVVKHL